MNIVFVVPFDYRKIGGEYLIINNYSKILTERGYSIHLLEFPYKISNNEKAKYEQSLMNIVKQYNCSIVIAYALNISVYVLRFLTKNKYKGKIISFMVDSMTLYEKSLLKYDKRIKHRIVDRCKYLLYYFKEAKCIKKYNAIIYVSAVDKNFAISIFNNIDKIDCVPNGTVIPQDYVDQRINGRDFPVLGMFTGMTDETARNNLFPFLEDIYPSLVNHYPNLELIVAGRGASAETIERIKRVPNVVFLGEVDKLEQFYDKIDVSIITVKKECGVINRVLEGWAYNKLVIGFSRNFYAFEHAINNQHYLSANNTDEFLDVLDKIINSIDLRMKIATNGKNLVKEYYTWEASAEKLISIIEE